MGTVIWTMMTAFLTLINVALMLVSYINGNTNNIILYGVMVIFWHINYRDSWNKL